MVKPIKKRIPKADEEAAEIEFDLEDESGASNEPITIGDQITAMADDEFTEKTAGLFKWIIDNGKVLAAVSALGVAGVVGYTLMERGDHAADAEASAAFFGAAEAADKARPLGAPKAGETQTAEAKKGQLEKARLLFESTKTSYDGRRVAQLAGLGEAGTHAALGQHDKALAGYETFIAGKDVDPFAKVVALQAKATVQENKKDFTGALATWTAIRDQDTKAFGLMAGMNMGRLLETQGKAAEARAAYEKLQKDFAEALGEMPNRAFKADLEKRLARLEKAS